MYYRYLLKSSSILKKSLVIIKLFIGPYITQTVILYIDPFTFEIKLEEILLIKSVYRVLAINMSLFPFKPQQLHLPNPECILEILLLDRGDGAPTGHHTSPLTSRGQRIRLNKEICLYWLGVASSR